MKTLALTAPHTISVYESMHELPVLRHAEFQVYRLYETGIGGDDGAISRHFAQLHQFLAAGRVDDAIDQAANLQYAHDFAVDRFAPNSLAFGCLVAAVDGEPATDLSEAGLRALLARLDGLGLTVGHVQEVVDAVKKKVQSELSAAFPQRYGDDAQGLATAQQLRRRLLAVCDYLATEAPEHLAVVAQVDAWLLDQQRPPCFDDGAPANVVQQMRRSFGHLCATLADHGTPQPELLTVFQFETRVDYLQQKFERGREAAGVR
ncbi:hypothetical protein LJ737_04210 [Hymenobacter sp. 15J16-1T3B]|uniref:hypothetical protein n=1 Tax=Hymenobacter sp. 15J16-1T3B TaxID=2886941 RepID=UPI001D0FF562|nr:hypothetical protein [Hymenobacter sp. 15J16-1T3B]MCC3156426.1 hypothetical protein [Hymenobacter sp. 15J16-1T3B]